jgi:biopolymer transport protein ExbD
MSLAYSRRHRFVAGIFTASMADVVFLLLVFFALTSVVSPDRTRVRLPESIVRAEAPREAAIISIASPADGQVVRVSNGREPSSPIATREEMASFVSNVVATAPGRPFLIKADKGVTYGHFDEVLDALKSADVKVIYLLSEQKNASAG